MRGRGSDVIQYIMWEWLSALLIILPRASSSSEIIASDSLIDLVSG